MIDVDWSTLFKTLYETVRVKVAVKDHSKIPKQRLFEINKKLHIVEFTVEVEQEVQTGNLNDGGGDNGGGDG
jgi:hypothetical protein